jgi:hypothetical protein
MAALPDALSSSTLRDAVRDLVDRSTPGAVTLRGAAAAQALVLVEAGVRTGRLDTGGQPPPLLVREIVAALAIAARGTGIATGPPEPPVLLTVAEMAARLQVSERTARRLAERWGCVKRSDVWLVDEQLVERERERRAALCVR